MGRKALGKQAKTHVLQIRLTETVYDRVQKVGGSGWARTVIEKAAEQRIEPERQSFRRSKRKRSG